MAHSAKAIANEIIRRGEEQHRVFTHLQIQKLVYYCHAWMLGIFDKPMVKESITAWKYGPVIQPLYKALSRHGSDRVLPIEGVRRASLSSDENDIVNAVIERYGGFSGIHLSRLTHAVGSPWHQTIDRTGSGGRIDDDLIREFYKNEYTRYQSSLDSD